jgi:DNA-binding NarL/FixJ family response regulator
MIRVVIIEDHPLMRSAISATLESDLEIKVTGSGSSSRELFDLLASRPCDVLLLDLYLPKMSGVEIIRTLRKEYPYIRILVFSSSIEGEDVHRSLQSGALGYLVKDANSAEVLAAVHEVSQGRAFLPPKIADVLISKIHQKEAHPDIDFIGKLTRREYQVLALLAEGLSNAQLSERLHISKETVRTHIYNMKKKLPVDNRSQLILLAVKHKSLKDR